MEFKSFIFVLYFVNAHLLDLKCMVAHLIKAN